MNKYHIRFNTDHAGQAPVWRVFENDVEHLVWHLDIRVPLRDLITVEDGVTKWNIYCEGTMYLENGTAVIV